MCLVSILLPIHRYEIYYQEAISSILNQSHKNFELIIIYETDDIKEKLEKRFTDHRIIYHKGARRGLAAALNEGITISKGKYIARMDSDDQSYPFRIEKQIQFIKINNLDICGCNIRTFGDSDYVISFPTLENEIKYFAIWGSPLAHPTILARSSVLKENLYNEKILASEDYDLWVRLLQSGYKMSNISEVLYSYRVHKNQGSKISLDQIKSDTEIADKHYFFLFKKMDVKLRRCSYGRMKTYSISQIDYLLLKIKEFYKNNSFDLQYINRIIISIILKCSDNNFIKLLIIIKLKHKIKIKKSILFYLFIKTFIPQSYYHIFYDFSKKIYK